MDCFASLAMTGRWRSQRRPVMCGREYPAIPARTSLRGRRSVPASDNAGSGRAAADRVLPSLPVPRWRRPPPPATRPIPPGRDWRAARMNIFRRARRQSALEQRAAEAADFLAYPGFGHGSILFAALSHALAARPSRDTEGQSREETRETPHARIRHPKTARRRHRAGLDGFWHGDLVAARGF